MSDSDEDYDWTPLLVMGSLVRARTHLYEAVDNWPHFPGRPAALYKRMDALAKDVEAIIEDMTRFAEAEEARRTAQE